MAYGEIMYTYGTVVLVTIGTMTTSINKQHIDKDDMMSDSDRSSRERSLEPV